jgi:hypothetical protein
MKKKIAVLVMMVLFLGAWSGVSSFAQGMVGHESMKHKGMMMGEGQEKGKMGKCPMMGMMKGMTGKSMVAASDGGVIVLSGNKLMKYDKNLNLVKEVEIKIDRAAIQEEMMGMMKHCPKSAGGAEEKDEPKE